MSDPKFWVQPTGWHRAHGEEPTTCRSCGAPPVWWFIHDRTLNRSPFDPDGTTHFATCPHAKRWRRK
jgi:hypothetical protein